MQGLPDISTVELTRTKLKLRDDLLFIPQRYGDETFYHIEVSTTSEFYRVGYPEYVFISLLNGRTSFAEALAVTSQKPGVGSLNQFQAMTVYTWLLDNGLASFSDADATASGATSSVRQTGSAEHWWKKLNPLWVKVPLGRPEGFFKALQPVFGWIFTVPVFILSLVLMIAAGVALTNDWSRFASDSFSVVAQENWVWLLAAWIGLKCVHEIAHGLVCLRYGGSIRETGFVLAIFTPLAYVDASSSWSFRSRWHRIQTAAAGVYIELVIASIAILVWSHSDSSLVRHILQNIIIMASVSTLVFNLNPLMRFDGYYVLSDLLQIPNLMTQSTQVVGSTARRIVFGESSAAPTTIGRERWILMTYGILATAWRLMISVSLLIAASVLFHGAGVALAAAGVVLWFGKPLLGFLKTLNTFRLQQPERLARAVAVIAFCISAAATLIFAVPAPVMITAPGIVEYTNGEVVRSVTAGFVEQVYVANGQEVAAGDLLVSLTNEEVSSKFADLQQRVAQEELRQQTANRDHNGGALSVAQGNLESLKLQLAECQKQVDGLQLRASRSGCVVAQDLNRLAGTFARPGQELLTIGREDQKELQISIGQRELAGSLQVVGKPVRVRIGTHGVVSGTLDRVNPQGSRRVPHPALAASNGGPLPVAAKDKNAPDDDSQDAMRLTDYRFTGIVSLEADDASQLRCGERGTASPGLVPASLGVHCWRSTRQWIAARLKQ
jgi:putative peptide zinc metalloprotease protein